MVEVIELGILSGMELDDPIKDADFMARIGAKQINGTTKYELTNAETGTKFAFQ